jgi:hypothetical protein
MKIFWGTFLRVFWIVFAWLMVLIGISGVISDFIYGRILSLDYYIFSIIYLPMMVALLGYAHRWRIWKSGVYFWRAYFFIYVASSISQSWLNRIWLPLLDFRNLSLQKWIGIVIPLILVILSVIGVYLYAFRFHKVTREPLKASS